MRITVLANQDLASCLALNYLLPSLSEHKLNVFLSSAVGAKNAAARPAQLQDLKFMEQQLFNEVLFPLLDATDQGNEAELKTFRGLSVYTEQPPQELNAINAGDGLAQFAASAPDLVLSIRYGSILKDPAIAVPRLGILNLHSGKLPDYRGVMASFWALLNDEPALATTLHYISDAGIDTGAIIGATELTVDRSRSYLWHVLELYKEGCQLMLSAVSRLVSGASLEGQAQPGEGQYFSFPSATDLDAFANKGLALFHADDLLQVAKKFMASSG